MFLIKHILSLKTCTTHMLPIGEILPQKVTFTRLALVFTRLVSKITRLVKEFTSLALKFTSLALEQVEG